MKQKKNYEKNERYINRDKAQEQKRKKKTTLNEIPFITHARRASIKLVIGENLYNHTHIYTIYIYISHKKYD